MTWHQAPLCSWDTETTSTDVETARIVTATFVRIVGAQVEAKQWIFDPGVPIPDEASRIHGVTTAIAQEKGTDPAEGVVEMADELCQAWGRNEPVVVMNAPFDFSILDREMRRHHGHGIEITGTVIDPGVIDRALDPYRRGKRTLTDLCAHYEVKIEGAHDATADALAAARVAYRLAQKYPEHLARVEDLNDLQTNWRSEWATGFAEYLHKQGKPTDDVSGAWPLRPYVEAAS